MIMINKWSSSLSVIVIINQWLGFKLSSSLINNHQLIKRLKNCDLMITNCHQPSLNYLKHSVWKMWPHGNFFELLTMSSLKKSEKSGEKSKTFFKLLHKKTSTNLQMMQMLSDRASSSDVASGYKVFMLWIARRDKMTSLSAFLKFL